MVHKVNSGHPGGSLGCTELFVVLYFNQMEYSNQNIFITGKAGSGKSTLLNLIAGLQTPTAGKILIDGQNISEITLSSLRKNISLVSQDIILFDDRGFHGPAQPSKADRKVIIFDYYRNKTFGSTVVKPHEVKINGPSKVIYSPDKPLTCGAKVWIETESEVITT